MSSDKVKCKKCDTEFLASTAEETGGICRGCKNGKHTLEDTLDKVELSLRFIFALGFAFFFATIGFALGAAVWSGIGLMLALIAFPIGFIFGFFFNEIKFFVRMFFQSIFSGFGE